jgi:hypothetical protein
MSLSGVSVSSASGSPMPGDVLQKCYRLVEPQERLQWSREVYEVQWRGENLTTTHPLIICEVAVPSDHFDTPSFIRAATKAFMRDHPRLLTPLQDVSMERGHCFFVFAPLPGESLQARLQRQGVLREEEVLQCCIHGAQALAWLSQQHPPRAHGWIHPRHLVEMRSAAGSEWALSTGSILVAAGAAPELTQGALVSADLHALLATMYTALTGATLSAHGTMPYVPFIQSALAAAFARGLHPREEQRLQHPLELLQVLGSSPDQIAPRQQRRKSIMTHVANAHDHLSLPLSQQDVSITTSPMAPAAHQTGERGSLLPHSQENLPPLPQRADLLVAGMWGAGILCVALLLLLAAR